MKKEKYFIITVDTEGDNLWDYVPGSEVYTRNAEFIPQFQAICDKYDYKPVYLSNYEMLNSSVFVNFAKRTEIQGRCEVGLHLHAWNNPPFYELEKKYSGNPYLIEYPYSIMVEKFRVLFDLYTAIFNHAPVSHRSGRWAMNTDYFRVLEKFGIKVDCSYTPGKNWIADCGQSIPSGSDYSQIKLQLYKIGNIVEVPMSIKFFRFIAEGSWKHKIKCLLLGQEVWMRTSISRSLDIKKLIDYLHNRKDVDYVEFMIHSSELMPGGSPYFKTKEAVKKHMEDIEEVFSYAKELGYKGITLADYYELIKDKL